MLCDHITPILPRLSELTNSVWTYNDIRQWDFPITNTSLGRELSLSFADPEYVMAMPIATGARAFLADLRSSNFEVIIVTARPPEAMSATLVWLEHHRLLFDSALGSARLGKLETNLDVLVDDFLGNAEAFLKGSDGACVLVAHPWNDDLSSLDRFRAAGRLVRCRTLAAVPAAISRILGSRG